MLTASEANSIARQKLFSKVEHYISAISEKIAKSAMNGYFRVGHEFSDDELEHVVDIVQYLKSIGYDVKNSNVPNYVTILW